MTAADTARPVRTSAPRADHGHETSDIDRLLEGVCQRVAPTWPLDRFIAVNPLWEMTEEPLPAVAAKLGALAGARLLMPRSWYREQWRHGSLRRAHLQAAISACASDVTVEQLEALLESDEPDVPRRARVTDVADLLHDRVHEESWCDFVTHSLSQFCAAYFDEGQARLGPDRSGGLYASWRRCAVSDRSPALLMRMRDYTAIARTLPHTPREVAALALTDLGVPPSEREAYLLALLLDLNGWAAWCAYRRWTARLAGADDDHAVDLLAMRLAWEWILLRSGGQPLAARWRTAIARWPAIDAEARRARARDWLLQRAVEIAWQSEVCRQLHAGTREPERGDRPAAQVVFCIDVRSEVFRRALEAQDPRLQTLGFAGFFGLPIEYLPLGAGSARPQLPGLLAPRLRVQDAGSDDSEAARRRDRLDVDSARNGFKTGATSGFAFVEALGLLSAGRLLGDAFARGRRGRGTESAGLSPAEDARRKPRLARAAGDDGDRCDLAAGILRAMSLTRGFARLVVLAGHGSETRNNPHRAGLDCGACCGQTGEVNARAAAALLNEPNVRAGLAQRGIDIPADTHFLPALHNTTTDEVQLLDLDELPGSHVADVAELRARLSAAAERARLERAERLGLTGSSGHTLLAALRQRAADWAQVRPEWGLADNAALFVARRERTRHLDLGGRAFLHEYRHEDDPDHAILELIMTAPLVVTHWINFQYYASTVDNRRYGSGNKVLHNVVGGHLGVFEGNGGDLRIGLPLQSLHDGERWVHTPLRLTAFIEAPREAIEGVLRKHAKLRSLVENEWIHLFQIDAAAGGLHVYRRGTWVDAAASVA